MFPSISIESDHDLSFLRKGLEASLGCYSLPSRSSYAGSQVLGHHLLLWGLSWGYSESNVVICMEFSSTIVSYSETNKPSDISSFEFSQTLFVLLFYWLDYLKFFSVLWAPASPIATLEGPRWVGSVAGSFYLSFNYSGFSFRLRLDGECLWIRHYINSVDWLIDR